jgi:CHASE2 domain-containing sensor protein
LPLLVYRSISEQFLWIFSWSVLVGSIWSSRRWKLSFVAMIGGQVVIICILLFIGQGLPIVLTSISMISVGSVMRAIFIGANTQRRMYNSLVKPL